VKLRPGSTATADELRSHISGRFASWWLPDVFNFLDEIPKTSTGKINKARLRDLLSAGG